MQQLCETAEGRDAEEMQVPQEFRRRIGQDLQRQWFEETTLAANGYD